MKMLRNLIYTILNIIFIVQSTKTTKSLDEDTSFDIFKENENPMKILRQGALHNHMNETYYSLVAPGLLKSNRKYSAVVSLHNAAEPCSINVSINSPFFNAFEEVLLQPFKSKIVNFFPPTLSYGSCILRAEGVHGCSFSQEKLLLVDVLTSPKIYIQTDKAVYKPQDLIQFRVLFLNEHTKPLNIDEPIQVEILDDKQNIVKNFKDVRFTSGVYTNNYKLSERPVMGTWSIRVSVGGGLFKSHSKSIEVKKYVLPKFSVHIKTPKHVVMLDNSLKAVVYGKYTFGKYVQGIATVQLWDQYSNELLQEKTVDVRTLVGVEFPLANISRTKDELNIVALIKEKYTGITRNETMRLTLHYQRYNIYANDDDFEFVVGGVDPYRLNVHVEYWNGAAVVDRKTPVILYHGEKSYESHIDDNGVAKLEFESQPNSGYSLYFADSSFYIPNVFSSRKEDNSSEYFCKLKLLGKRLQLGAPVKILVSSSEDIPNLVYAVVGHGNIIEMRHIKLPPKQKSYTIHIKPTIELIPVAYIYVHYSSNGIFRYNEMELVFPREFENKISLMAPKKTEPGQEILVQLNAQPRSFVGLLAVDLGVHLLDPSYDLQRENIMNDLAEEKSYISSKHIENGEYLLSGLVILTNLKHNLTETNPKKMIRESDVGTREYRTQFPEVWIFQNIEVNSTNTKLSFKLPDSITTWRITAFSVNDKTGLGIVDSPTDVTAIKTFFISLSLPYSVKWGEIVAIPVLVFNYHSQSLDSIITMHNEEHEFEFMNNATRSILENQQRKIVQSVISANDGQMFSFYIKPLKTGLINLRITASNDMYSDAVHQQLKVETEGVSRSVNQAVYLNPKIDSSTSLEVETPTNVETSSNDISLLVGADYIVPIMDNLQSLVGMPTGCGEQNMVHFAPNILVLQYLKSTNNYAKQKKLVDTIKSYIDIGYQQQLSYRHKNGGYSVFGQSIDEEASTWLTAYAVRFFIKASKFAYIEPRIIETGLEYLSNEQLNDGSFPYTGYLFHPAQENKYGLTAFILATFLEDRTFAKRYQQIIHNGIEFLVKNLDDIEDAYALSIVAFVLQMQKNSNAPKLLEKLEAYRHKENDLIWWSEKDNNNENNVEITAYVLMALLDAGTTSENKPILKWLLKQRNDKGGFLSTQDTVVGLQALVKFNQRFADERNISMEIKYTATNQEGNEVKKGEFKVDRENFMTTQKHELPKNTNNVSLQMSGTGSALVQLSHQYKLLDAATAISPMITSGPKSRKKNDVSNAQGNDIKYFIIQPKATALKNDDLELEICFSFQNKTNMVIMEINLPSGYRTDDETLADLKNNAFIQRVENRNAYTTIIIYLDKLAINVENCITTSAYKGSEVLQRKPVAIVMYDYYNTQLYNTIFYNI